MGSRSFQELSPADLEKWKAWDRQNTPATPVEDAPRQYSRTVQPAPRNSRTPAPPLTDDDETAWSEFLEGKSGRIHHSNSKQPHAVGRNGTTGRRRGPVGRNATLQLDKRIVSRLAAGKQDPESILDLHGKTVDESLRAIRGFVQQSRHEGLRLILIITGKGNRSRDDLGVRAGIGKLKQTTEVFLKSQELRQHVQYFRVAHRKHGGSGAYYVYLRRN